MAETKEFPTEVVLTVVAGPLLCEIGENLFTHQLPRVAREAAPAIIIIVGGTDG